MKVINYYYSYITRNILLFFIMIRFKNPYAGTINRRKGKKKQSPTITRRELVQNVRAEKKEQKTEIEISR